MSNNILILIMIVFWGVGCFFYKIANNNIHPIVVSTIVTILYVILTPLAWIFLKFDSKVNLVGTLSALAGGLFVCIASLAYFMALRKGDAGQVTALSSMYPVLTLILSMLFFGEQLSVKKAIGIALACCSFFFLSKN